MKRCLIVLSFFLASCSRQNEPNPQAAAPKKVEPIEVVVTRAEERRIDKSILVTGSLLADETVTISSEIQGRIATIRVDFGQFVRQGEVIAELDKTEFQLNLERSKAALAQAMARVGLSAADIGKTPTNTTGMRQAQAQLEDARFKFESAQKLVKSGDISQDRFNELEKAYHARVAAFEATKDEMRTMWASVEGLQADVKLQEKRLRDATIRAPFDGSISERKVAPGQFIKDNVPIVTLVKTNPMRLRLEVPESAAGVLKVGTTLEFNTDAVPDHTFKATIRELNPMLNEQSRTLVAEARITSKADYLRPGMFVQVKLTLAHDIQAVVVPKQAVYTVAGLTKLFIVRNGKLVECRVPPGQFFDQWMEVPAGQVQKGDQVVITNIGQLSDGQEVRVKVSTVAELENKG